MRFIPLKQPLLPGLQGANAQMILPQNAPGIYAEGRRSLRLHQIYVLAQAFPP